MTNTSLSKSAALPLGDTILSSSACLFYSKKSIKKKGVKKILKLLSKN